MKSFLSRSRLLTALAVLILALSPVNAPVATAQATSSGTITGVVTDPSGAVVPDATITVVDPGTKTTRTTVSNANGQYVLPNVPPGIYKVTAVKPGFSTDSIASLTVTVATQTTANFKMAVGSESTTVDVQASNADLQTLNAATGGTIDPALVDSLPAIGRDASQFAAFMPGVTPSGAVAGTVADQAVFQLDGGNNSSDMDGSMQSYTGSFGGSSTGGFLAASSSGVMPMPQDSVEEFRVSTSGQTADFNNSSGMEASVVTKRGHDKWHGTVYEYYLDNNIGANTWQNNFANITGVSSYTPKPSYHYSRFGAAAGGKIPKAHFLGGDTYVFANYEGFRWPLATTYERTVPSYQFLQLGQLTFPPKGSSAVTYSAAALKAADPNHEGYSKALINFYNTQLPVAPISNTGSASYSGATLAGGTVAATNYNGTFDPSCGALSTAYCDGINTIGYKGNVLTPQTSNFFVTRIDHDFGQKWHANASFHYFKFVTTTANQVDIGGGVAGDTVGNIKALAPRPQDPLYIVAGLTTNISSTLTNDFHISFLRNFWQWKDAGDAPQITGASGAVEPLGESSNTTVLAPYNVNAQNTRTRIWDGKDTFFRDDITKLKGNHLIQGGFSYQRNVLYHQRTDNGNAINYSTTYQIGDASGGGNVTYTNTGGVGLGAVGANASTAYARLLDTYFGIVTDTQVANTYTNANGMLSLNPPRTAFSAKPTIPYYNVYATDTWKLKPSITLNYGLSYAIEMPPSESQGNQVMFTDATGNAIQVQQYLANRKAAAIAGTVYNPEIGFALIKNVQNAPGGGKYPYNPYYAAVSPRVSVAWNPNFKSKAFGKLFGDGSTVMRFGYSRIYGRINGDIQTLNPILSPGLVLATQCRFAQSATYGTGACTQSNFNDTTAFRFGNVADGQDGLVAPLAAAPLVLNTPVYRPGYDGPGVAIASPVDPSYKPNYVDTFNVSIQRQVNRRVIVEVGYIGRLIKNELETLNPNAVPYMTSQGGQSFSSAYLALETAYGCTNSAGLCAYNTSLATTGTGTPKVKVYPTVPTQAFFEAALGGTSSAYCTGYVSCTQAVAVKQAANIGAQKVFSLWQALDNNTGGTTVPGFVFPRSLMGTATGTSSGSAGQVGTGLSVATSAGYGNYHGAYLTVKSSGFHGLTFQETLTFSKALGLDDSAQSSSGLIANDSYDLHKSYGLQTYNQKYIFNTFVVYEVPYYKDQRGIIGRVAGGWTLSPVVTAGTGQPLTCTSNNGGQSFGGTDGSNFNDNEQCVFTTPYKYTARTHRGIFGGSDALGNAVGTSVHAGGPAAAVNIFSNPVAIYNNVRPPILGLDNSGSGTGPIAGLGYLNLDLSVKKKIIVAEGFSLEATGVFLNALNHMEFANPSLSLQSVSSFGVTKTQGNSPRQIQMGIRANF